MTRLTTQQDEAYILKYQRYLKWLSFGYTNAQDIYRKYREITQQMLGYSSSYPERPKQHTKTSKWWKNKNHQV